MIPVKEIEIGTITKKAAVFYDQSYNIIILGLSNISFVDASSHHHIEAMHS